MRVIVCILMVVVSPLLYGGEQHANATAAKGVGTARKNPVKIDGQFIDYINVAFGDYVKNESDMQLTQIKYYTFEVKEWNKDVIYVDIQINNRLLKESGRQIYGGGGGYYIDKKSGVIVDHFLYK